jgi:hypothetical protein
MNGEETKENSINQTAFQPQVRLELHERVTNIESQL